MKSSSHRRTKDELFALFARIGAALASPKRLEILDLLSQTQRSVEALAAEAESSVANTSAHLRVLHAARLVDRRRDGQRVVYRLADPAVFRFLRELQGLGRRQLAEIEHFVRRYFEAPAEFEPVAPAELLRLMKQDGVLVLDVRPAEEYLAGHLAGARNVPPNELVRRLARLPSDREIVAYCRGPYCLFSVEAVDLLRRKGFRARRLAGGFPDWAAAGHPVAVGPA
jgi:rhodanese-related sulfurtransferase/DNA-binding MarR family transcriptional regulator